MGSRPRQWVPWGLIPGSGAQRSDKEGTSMETRGGKIDSPKGILRGEIQWRDGGGGWESKEGKWVLHSKIGKGGGAHFEGERIKFENLRDTEQKDNKNETNCG